MNKTPCGAQTYSKANRYFSKPVILDHGKGSHVWDEHGKEYIDFIAALGPVTIGYSDDRVNIAISKQLEKGISFSTPTRIEYELCEKLTQIIPATMAAVRLARAYTGRDIILKAGYHGCDDWSIGPEPGARGIPFYVSQLTKRFKYNNIADLEQWFSLFHNKIAGIILESVMENGPGPRYLEAVKELCHRNGTILIFDEVVSGARFALGGAAEVYSVTPDLTCIGKGYGNGMPISAVCGRSDIMHLIETGEAFISTTFGGETLSIAAALETIKILEQPGTYEHIWGLGEKLIYGLRKMIDGFDLTDVLQVTGLPPHCGLSFNGAGSLDYLDIWSLYAQETQNAGILSQGMNFIMLSHTEQDIDALLGATLAAMAKIKKAIEQDSTEGILTSNKINPIFKRR
jgi:glutamate-1-semialdehyde aminotransferase